MSYVNVSVDIDDVLPEIETRDLEKELFRRGPQRADPEAPNPAATLNELRYALQFGLNDRALEIARRHVNDQLGTAL